MSIREQRIEKTIIFVYYTKNYKNKKSERFSGSLLFEVFLSAGATAIA
jgi:hypothetical protein